MTLSHSTPEAEGAPMSNEWMRYPPLDDPALCQTCGMPYAWPLGASNWGCEAHLEAHAEGVPSQDPEQMAATIKGALAILVAMRGWCAYDVEDDFDRIICDQIRTYYRALDKLAVSA